MLNKEKSLKLEKILKQYSFTDISVCVLNLDTDEEISYNPNNFIYPASCYKVFIGAEVLRNVELGKFKLSQELEIKHPNDIDAEAPLYPTEIFPVLKAGDKLSIDKLLSLVFYRSDNTASNTLIDLVGRENITKNIIHKYGWHGSGITRKFLNRSLEKKKYRFSETTMSCSKHLAEFFILVEKGEMVSPFVSSKLKEYMSKSYSRRIKLFLSNSEFYGKSGSMLNRTNSILTNVKVLLRYRGFSHFLHDCGFVDSQGKKYAISILTYRKSPFIKYIDFQKLSKQIFDIV